MKWDEIKIGEAFIDRDLPKFYWIKISDTRHILAGRQPKYGGDAVKETEFWYQDIYTRNC